MNRLPSATRSETVSTPPPPKKSKKGLWIGLGILLVLVCAIAGWFFLQSQTPKYLTYRNQELLVLKGVPRNEYVPEQFSVNENGYIGYQSNQTSAALGIDVSFYQQNIDWEQVADSGIEFAMIRLGYRGYSTGVLKTDSTFEQNIQGATAAGLDVGIYFFSQATSILEAQEEAEYVLEAIRGYPIGYPVVFDWEFITSDDSARTNTVDGATATECALAFCDFIAAAGYTPMVYFNQDMGYLFYQLDLLSHIPFWLAEYDQTPDFYYHFDMWQYTHTGTVPGIEGAVDLNLSFRDWSKPQE